MNKYRDHQSPEHSQPVNIPIKLKHNEGEVETEAHSPLCINREGSMEDYCILYSSWMSPLKRRKAGWTLGLQEERGVLHTY